MRTFLELLAILGVIVGGIVLLLTLAYASGAPQQAAGAAIAVAFAVIPYCLASLVQRYHLIRQSRD